MFHRPSPIVPDVFMPKWSREVLQEGFVPLPKRLMRCLNQIFKGKDATEKLQVVLAIADSKRLAKDGVEPRPPTLGFLAYNAGMTEEQFGKFVGQLQVEGLLSVVDPNDKNFDVDLRPLLRRIETLTPKGS